jgi:integrase
MAVRHRAMPFNPVRDSRPIGCPRKPVRALTEGECADLLSRLRADPEAVRLDLPDFVEFMLGTGLRIGEAAAVRTSVLDLDAGTVHVNATVVRVAGRGLQIQLRTKTAGSERFLADEQRSSAGAGGCHLHLAGRVDSGSVEHSG